MNQNENDHTDKVYGRKYGHWSFERQEHYFDDYADVNPDIGVLSLRPSDRNWDLITQFNDLEEITAVKPSRDQLDVIFSLRKLKRLRICGVRKMSLEKIGTLQSLEELAFFDASGPKELSVLQNLPRLKSLLIANMRSIDDFSDLSTLHQLRCFCVEGSIETDQKINDFGFVRDMQSIEHLAARKMRTSAEYPIFAPLVASRSLKSISLSSYDAPLKEWTYAFHHLADKLVAVLPAFSYLQENKDWVSVGWADVLREIGFEGSRAIVEYYLKGQRSYRGSAAGAQRNLKKFQDSYRSEARKIGIGQHDA